jgi:hypothetical protein
MNKWFENNFNFTPKQLTCLAIAYKATSEIIGGSIWFACYSHSPSSFIKHFPYYRRYLMKL